MPGRASGRALGRVPGLGPPVHTGRQGEGTCTGRDDLRLASRASLAVVVSAVVLWTATGPWHDSEHGVVVAVTVAGLVAGLPHGAVDLVALRPAGSGGLGRSARVVLLAATGYVVLAAAAWQALRAAPAAGLAVFLALSVAHFGTGETTFLRMREVPVARSHALAAGLVVVLLPLAVHPGAVAPYLALLVPAWDGRVDGQVAAAVTLLVLLTALASGGRAARSGQWRPAAELAALVALAVLLPPAAAIAVYFGGWHAVRHTAVLLHDERQRTGPGAVGRLVRQGAVPTIAAAAVLALLWWGLADARLDRFVAEQVLLLAALTVPHAVAVARLDRLRPGAAG